MAVGDLEQDDSDLPSALGGSVVRTLTTHGYRTLAQLDGVPAEEIADLQGIGPRALRRLREALEDRGLSLG